MRLLISIAVAALCVAPIAAEEQVFEESGIAGPIVLKNGCSGPGVVQYDDGTVENGQRPLTALFRGEVVQLFDPPVPGALITDVCVCWQTVNLLGGDSLFYDIRVYDDDGPGGAPGTLLGEVPLFFADNIPFGVAGSLFTADISALGLVADGPVYIGASWFPGIDEDIFFCTDESPSTPSRPVYAGVVTGPGDPPSVLLNQSTDTRAAFIRAAFGAPPACLTDGDTLCLGDRFKVEVTWRDFAGNTGRGQAVALDGREDSGLFWFFRESNLELLVKVLNGCGLTQHYWVFAAGTTDVEFEIVVTDTERGVEKRYTNPLGTAAPAITDTLALATCP